MFSSTILQCIKLEITKNTFFLPVLIQHHQQQGNRERKREKEKKGLSLTRELGNTKRQMRGSSSYYRLWTRNRLFFFNIFFFISCLFLALSCALGLGLVLSWSLVSPSLSLPANTARVSCLRRCGRAISGS